MNVCTPWSTPQHRNKLPEQGTKVYAFSTAASLVDALYGVGYNDYYTYTFIGLSIDESDDYGEIPDFDDEILDQSRCFKVQNSEGKVMYFPLIIWEDKDE